VDIRLSSTRTAGVTGAWTGRTTATGADRRGRCPGERELSLECRSLLQPCPTGRDATSGKAAGAGVERGGDSPQGVAETEDCRPGGERAQACLRSPDWAGGVPVRRRGKPGDEGGGGRQASPPVAGGRTGVPRLSPRVGRDRGVSKTPPRPAGDGLGSPSSRSTTTNWGRRRR
jgi:hypothetical protein